MENLDLHVLRSLLQWRQSGRPALLATVTRAWGSSPRPVGSIMALCEGGSVVGSVSGGCIEDGLVYRYRDGMCDGPPQRVKYGVSADEAHRFGLPCGGTLELLLEFNPSIFELSELVTRLASGDLVQRRTHIGSGRVALADTDVAAELVESDGWMPDDVVSAFRADQRTAIVALTHDPKLDDLALLEALDTSSFYIGAIGSRRNQSARRSRLKEHFEQTDETLSRLRTVIV